MTDEHEYRLPRTVVPRRYELTLSPDLAAATFSGEAAIEVDVADPARHVVVNAVDLEIDQAWLVDAYGTSHSASVTLDPANERVAFALDGTAQPGPAVLHVRFRGVLNDQLRGFYRSTFKDEAGNDKVIAVTQFESTSARRAFPCWDEPDLKAIFSITLVVDGELTALANTKQISDERTGDGRRRVRFADTMPLSTYLVAFIVGELELTEPIDVDGVPMRIVHQPGKSALTGFAEECGVFATRFFADYFGIAFPTDKLDLVGLPDFAAGAMENLGLVTFREALLLVDPATATQAEELVIANVVAHEIAHMWFGDLVTMRWWNGLWLKEAFATFMAQVCIDAMKPEWHVWDTFGLDRTAALETDALESTRAIEYPVHSPHDAEGMYDVLTYEKGAAVLRMLEQYLGADEFRAGVRAYLSKHAYGNTENTDLWDAIEAATSEPARRIMDAWIFQGGYPLVRVSPGADGSSARLTQRRFVYSDIADATQWPVPLHIRQSAGGETTNTRLLLDSEHDDISLDAPDAVVLVNAGGHGFLRVRYEAPFLDRLAGPALAEMSTIERYNLVDDAWAAVVAGEASATEYLHLARGFGDESTLPVWQALSAGLGFCDRLIDDPEAREQFRTFVRGLAGPALHRLGWAPRDREDDLTGELRGLLIRTVAILGDDRDAQAKARALYQQSLDDPASVAPPVASAALTVFASTGDAADYDHVLDVFGKTTNPQEQLRHLWALADFDSAELMDRTCELTLTDTIRSQNSPFLLARCMRNRDHGEQAWRFVARNWTTLNERFPSTSIIRMVDGVRLLMRPEQASEVARVLLRAGCAAGGQDPRAGARATADQRRVPHARVRPAGCVASLTVPGTGAARRLEIFAVDVDLVQVCWSDLPRGMHTLSVTGGPTLEVEGGGPGGALIDGLRADSEVEVSLGGARAKARTLAPPPGPELARIATISDLHFGERRFGRWPRIRPGAEWRDAAEPYPVVCTRAAVREAIAWGAQLIVVKGDLTDEDYDDEYDSLGAVLAAVPVPVVVIPGNHDGGDRSNGDGVAVLARHGIEMTTGVRVVDVPGLRVVVASSRSEGRAPRQPHAAAPRDHRRSVGGARRSDARDASPALPHGYHHDLAAGDHRPRRAAPVARRRERASGDPDHRRAHAPKPAARLPGHADHRGRITEGLPGSVGRLRRARRWHPSGRAAYLRPDGDVLDRTVRRHAHGLVALLVEGKSRRSVLLTRLAHHSTSSSDPITGWASMRRCSKPTSQGIQPRRSGHASCTTRNGTAP